MRGRWLQRIRDRRLLWGLIVVATCWVDLQTPLGVNVAAAYFTGILVAGWCGRRDAWIATIAVTLLTGLGALASPAGGEVSAGLFNRALDAAIFWGSLGIILRGKQAAGELEDAVRMLSEFKYALDQSSIVAITDRRGRITYVNDAFCEISQYSRDELLGQDHRIVSSGHHPKAFMQDLWRTIERGHVWHGEIKNRAKDGGDYWVETTIVPFLDGRRRPYQHLAIHNDVTRRKQAEARLHEQQALARLGQMAAVVAHEVKNPLAAVLGSLQIVRSRLPRREANADLLDLMARRLRALNVMVDDLLTFARPKPLAFEDVHLRRLLRETAALLQRDARASGVTVEIEGSDDAVLRGDGEQLRQAVLNLLVNAAQAMAGEGVIRASVRAERSQCRITITDEGDGVPREIRERVFEPFFTTKARGTGLGLAIVKQVVERHGGAIALSQAAERGTSAVVTLPLVPAT